MRTVGLVMLLAAVAATAAAGPLPMLVGSAGAGLGAYTHASNSGFFHCPVAAVAFEHAFVTGTLGLQANAAPKTFGQTVEDFGEHALPCGMGTNVAFGIPDWTGNPQDGYQADRVTDLGPLAGVTTEHLVISSFDQPPVHVSYWAQTVGGPAPSTWWLEADMVQAQWS